MNEIGAKIDGNNSRSRECLVLSNYFNQEIVYLTLFYLQ